MHDLVIRGTNKFSVRNTKECSVPGCPDYSRHGTKDGIGFEVVDTSGPTRGLSFVRFYSHRDHGSPFGLEFAMTELSLGLGVGKRLQSVDSVKRNGEVTALNGTIRLPAFSDCHCILEFGPKRILRKAEISVGHDRKLHIQTKGSVLKNGFWFAKNGCVKWTGPARSGNEREAVTREYTTEFKNVQFSLSDEKFLKLAEIVIPKHADVIDPEDLSGRLGVTRAEE